MKKGDDEEEEEETPDASIEEIKTHEEVPSDVPEEEAEKVADDSEDTDEVDAFTDRGCGHFLGPMLPTLNSYDTA